MREFLELFHEKTGSRLSIELTKMPDLAERVGLFIRDCNCNEEGGAQVKAWIHGGGSPIGDAQALASEKKYDEQSKQK